MASLSRAFCPIHVLAAFRACAVDVSAITTVQNPEKILFVAAVVVVAKIGREMCSFLLLFFPKPLVLE